MSAIDGDDLTPGELVTIYYPNFGGQVSGAYVRTEDGDIYLSHIDGAEDDGEQPFPVEWLDPVNGREPDSETA